MQFHTWRRRVQQALPGTEQEQEEALHTHTCLTPHRARSCSSVSASSAATELAMGAMEGRQAARW